MSLSVSRAQEAITHGELAPYVELVGDPVMSLVAFASKPGTRDIYVVNDALAKKDWKMSALQSPPALHMCFTPAHSLDVVDALIRDLVAAYEVNVAEKGGGGDDGDDGDDEGMAPLYGMAAKVPDKRIVGEFLVAYQDLLLEC